MQRPAKVYQIYYSKDVRKKKKVFSEGILLCEEKRTKLYTQNGDCILTINSKSQPQQDQEYTINNNYIVSINHQVPIESFLTGKIFMKNQVSLPPVKKPKNKKDNTQKVSQQIAKEFPNGLKIQSFIFFQLREHQIQGVNFMYDCLTGKKGKKIEGCILADFMGLGKTLQTLTLIRCLLISKTVSKVVVICPLTLIKVWEKECSKWMGNKLNPLIAFGSSEQITKVMRMFTQFDYRFMIASYENFYKFSDKLNQRCDLLIFDEGHRLKNKKSKLLKKILTFKCRKRILLTGTPIQNNLDQLYTCIMLVNPSFFESQLLFKNVFQKPIVTGMAKSASKDQRALALTRTAELANLIKQFSLRRKADVLESFLPIKRQYQIFLKLSPLQHTLYERILKRKINDTQVLSYLNQMRKLFTHPLLFKTDRFDNYQWQQCHEDCRQEKSNKIDFVLSMAIYCQKHEQKLIIVSYFTETLDFIQSILSEHGISSSKLDGRLDGTQRYKCIQNFVRFKTVLLLSGKAGGTGLTLTCACKMIMIEPDWNPSNDSQVMGRIWRQGQTKQVQIFRLMICSSFEQKILQRQQLKQSLSQKLIDQQKNTKSYDYFSMKQLFTEILPKCLTYSQQINKKQQCKEQMTYLSWNQCIFVNIIQSHKKQKAIIENEFQQAQFQQHEDASEVKQLEQLISEQDLNYIDLREQYDSDKKNKIVDAFSRKSEKVEEKNGKQYTQKSQINQILNYDQNLITTSKTNCQFEPKKEDQIPIPLRKMKKNISKNDD